MLQLIFAAALVAILLVGIALYVEHLWEQWIISTVIRDERRETDLSWEPLIRRTIGDKP